MTAIDGHTVSRTEKSLKLMLVATALSFKLCFLSNFVVRTCIRELESNRESNLPHPSNVFPIGAS